MSSQVPLWVTIAVALVGFAGVLSAQFVAAWREDRRWRRDQEREDKRWDRERVKELENRSYEGRQNAYVQIIAAVEAYDWLVYPVVAAVRRIADNPQVLRQDQRGDVWRAREELRHSLGPVTLFASERFSDMLRRTMLPRSRLAMYMSAGKAPEWTRVKELWDESQAGFRKLRGEMRKDLGLEALPDD
ncbi:hypothetical protein LWC34_48310 [Kibdelosporangium philippinense]|uniref:DUF4760 domain-containing protein n=1 Tax=Kibdelosporangium philippinense TaxID=211113 RepID=A0ABS8ZXB1_9PSEU|nr:hypothetical protein [Kibdelosporangium philippinense]MCE7010557.1 hypothetical protein [Kibdelosporangium philippinense]